MNPTIESIHNSLHDRALACVKNYKRSEKYLVDVLSEIDRTRGYLRWGVSSLFRYCVEKLGLSEPETMRFTQVVRKSAEVPALREAIEQGLLTVSKASRIAPVITQSNSETWIEKALSLTHREIEREVAKVNPKSLRQDKIQIRTANLSELRVTISKELEIKIRRAQDVLGAKNLLEALEKMVDITLKQKDPVARAERASRKAASKSSETDNIKDPNTATNKLPATWQVRPSAVFPSRAPNLLRSPISASLKNIVFMRDQGLCGFKDCRESRFLHMHHVQPLSMGGKNSPENLMLLCSSHHRMMHGGQHRAFVPRKTLLPI